MKQRNEQLLALITYAVIFAAVFTACKWLAGAINLLPD